MRLNNLVTDGKIKLRPLFNISFKMRSSFDDFPFLLLSIAALTSLVVNGKSNSAQSIVLLLSSNFSKTEFILCLLPSRSKSLANSLNACTILQG